VLNIPNVPEYRLPKWYSAFAITVFRRFGASDDAPAATAALGAASPGSHHLNTVMANAEYHFGNRVSGAFGWFDTHGTADPLLFVQEDVSGSANGDPRSSGYITSFSYWPWQNVQLGAQYTGYKRFNGAQTNYDGAGRNANSNNTIYLLARFIF